MYIHVGDDILIKTEEIIAIFDKESLNGRSLEKLLAQYKQSNIHYSKGLFKSVIVTKDHVYYSPLTTGTLKRRSTQIVV